MRRAYHTAFQADPQWRRASSGNRILVCSGKPLTVFDIKGIPAIRRERIEAAVQAGGKRLQGPYEAWISSDPFRGCVKVLITGPHGFERTLSFAIDDAPAVIQDRVRERVEG
jgi:hypothetical protein